MRYAGLLRIKRRGLAFLQTLFSFMVAGRGFEPLISGL